MNEDFIPFELAKKLKEKGFMEKCIATYDIGDRQFDSNNYVLRVAYQMNVAAKDCLRLFNNTNTGLIDAPTISQVLKWLREKKNIYCLPWFEQGVDMWFYAICKPAHACEFPEFMSESDYDTYEEAALAGIEYVIDNLI